MDLNAIAQGLAAHPTAWMLALAVLAIGYLYRENMSSKKELIDTVIKQENDHRDTLTRIVPLSEKVVESVEILERVTDALIKRSEQ